MSNSLFDQLKKSGLVDDKKARKHKQEVHQSKKNKSKKEQATAVVQTAQFAQKSHADKVASDRLLNQQRKEEVDRKAQIAQIRQLIDSNKITQRDGDLAYHFTDGKLVKHIYINETLHKQLSMGLLAISKFDDQYELVPNAVAEKIRQRAPEAIITNSSSAQNTSDDNDPYAAYKIPDDLMW